MCELMSQATPHWKSVSVIPEHAGVDAVAAAAAQLPLAPTVRTAACSEPHAHTSQNTRGAISCR